MNTSLSLPEGGVVLVADIGRTNCRLGWGVGGDDRVISRVEVPSGASLSDPGGSERILGAWLEGWRQLGATHPDLTEKAVTKIVIGTTGGQHSPDAGARVGDGLRHRFGDVELILTSDVVVAHAGALGGRPGVVTVAGTGAVALSIASDGEYRLVDGHGPFLGDDGSGFAIGRRGLRAALRHRDGRPGGSPALATAATERWGLDELVNTIQSSSEAIMQIASFAHMVEDVARSGDPVAQKIVADAVADLTETTGVAIRTFPDDQNKIPVALTGSVFTGADHINDADDGRQGSFPPIIGAMVSRELTTRFPNVVMQDQPGSALKGALLLGRDNAGIHEPLVLTIGPRISPGDLATSGIINTNLRRKG